MMTTTVRVDLSEIAVHFQGLEDPRSDINQRHPLVSVTMIALMAVLAGANGPTAIAKWAVMKEDLLRKCLPLPNGIPRKDVFRRVLSALKPDVFQACYFNWLASLRAKAEAATGVTQPLLAFAGKTSRRSHDRSKGLGALHSVSVWAVESGLTLGQVACAEKSNEITAIPELLKLVHIEGAIITIDAMGTQTAIAKQIVDGKADYVLALKGNQGTLHQAAIDYVDEQLANDFAGVDAQQHITREKGHGREETRIYIQMPAPKSLPGFGRWKGLMTIGVAMLTCLRNGKETSETRYFISSLAMGVKRFAHAVRGHWAIENTCHWSLDFTFREDESRIHDENLRENFAWLNRFTLSLLKQHSSKNSKGKDNKDSIVMKRRCCGWNDEFLLEVLTTQTT
jgi:predicted transposase YbfD/YdcC